MLELNIPAGPVRLTPSNRNGIVATAILDDPSTGARSLEIVGADGQTLIIPQPFLEALAGTAGRADSDMTAELNKLRRAAIDPTALGLRKIENKPNQYVLADHEGDIEDGIPVMSWVPFSTTPTRNQQPSEGGWTLKLHGAHAQLGFAAWDDIDGLTDLVDAMRDPESLFALGGLIDADSIGALTSRLLARDLRRGRSLPGIDLGKVRKILTAAGLDAASRGFEPGERYGSPRGRVITIKSDSTQVPVAVAVSGAVSKPRSLGGNTRQHYSVATQETAEWNEEWLAQVTTAMTAAGWRQVDLPLPQSFTGTYAYQSQRKIAYFTRLDAEQWGSVARAAERVARELEVTRGSVL